MNLNDFWVQVISSWSLLLNILHIRRKYHSNVKLDGKVVVITGANTGIGKETAFQLSLRGAKIIIGCRNLTAADNAIKDIKQKNPSADISSVQLDLSSLTSVRNFARTVTQTVTAIDILINNAGVAMCPEMQSEDGYELQFATNHLGHFLLTLSLIPLLERSQKARVISIASTGHSIGEINFSNINLRNSQYSPLKAYAQSKLANVLFIRELTRRLAARDSCITTYCVDPGVVATDIARHSHPWFAKINNFILVSPEVGARTTLYCALEESPENETGRYYRDCGRVDRLVSRAVDDSIALRLWQLSSDLVKLEEELKI